MQTIEEQYGKLLHNSKFDKRIEIKTEIVQKFGKKGIAYLLEQKKLGSVTFLNEIIDSSCPWFSYKELPIELAIDKVWAPICTHLPTFLPLLKERCKHLLVIQHETEWQLAYYIDIIREEEQPFFTFYLGASPISQEAEKERRKITKDYQQNIGAFYQIHNGFGELESESILPLDELTPIKVDKTLYLSFFDFTSKARQCIKVDDLKDPNPISYDHDRGRIQIYHPFWSFIDERLALFDEE